MNLFRRAFASPFSLLIPAALLAVVITPGAFSARTGQLSPKSGEPAPLMHWTFDAAEPASAHDVVGNVKDAISGKFAASKAQASSCG